MILRVPTKTTKPTKNRILNRPKLNEITIPYHLAIPTITCIVGLLTILFYRKRLFAKNKLLWTSVIVFLFLYISIVGVATYDTIYYQWDLNRYDLDKDGFFGGEEITKEQEAAMQRLTNDVGRNFSFIIGFVFAGFISTIVYVVGRLLLNSKKTKTTHNPT